MKVVDHVRWRASIGHGLDWHMLGLLLQELFKALKLANPARVTGLCIAGLCIALSFG